MVAADRLIDDLYGAAPPADVANALQSQISRLREALPEPVVKLRSAGLTEALDLWRGPRVRQRRAPSSNCRWLRVAC